MSTAQTLCFFRQTDRHARAALHELDPVHKHKHEPCAEATRVRAGWWLNSEATVGHLSGQRVPGSPEGNDDTVVLTPRGAMTNSVSASLGQGKLASSISCWSIPTHSARQPAILRTLGRYSGQLFSDTFVRATDILIHPTS